MDRDRNVTGRVLLALLLALALGAAGVKFCVDNGFDRVQREIANLNLR